MIPSHLKVVFLISLLIVLDSAYSVAGEFPPDLQRIMSRGHIIVAMHREDFPPLFMHDKTGRFYGLDVSLAQDIGRRLGVGVKFNRKAETFDAVIDIVSRREADVAISYLSRTLERAKRVRFTEPYLILRQAWLVNRLKAAQEKKGQDIVEILKNKDEKIGVLGGSSHIGYVKEAFPRAVMKQFKILDPDLIEAVLKGDLFAGFFDELGIKKVIRQRPEISLHLQMVVLEGKEDPIAMAVPWDSVHLLSWLNLYLKTVRLDLTADNVLDQYSEILGK
jgi:polar amino acid transport system substrate-binding protein